MADTKNLMIVSISAEPKTTSQGKPFWISVDSDDTEWLCWDQAVADAVRERKMKEVEYSVNVSEKGDKTYRSIQGIPGVIEPQRKSGGGRQYTPKDPWAEERAKYPSFALSYAKDLAIARGTTDSNDIMQEAKGFLNWIVEKQEALRVTYQGIPKVEPKSEGDTAQRVQDRGGSVAPAPAAEEPPGPVNAELAQRPLKIKLIGEIKRLDPGERHTTHEQLYEMPFEMLEQIKRDLNAERLAS